MNNPVCPICSSKQTRFSFEKFNYSIYLCRSCSSKFVFPPPSDKELIEYYNSSESSQLSSARWTEQIESSHAHVFPQWDRAFNQIEEQVGIGRMLDVGCGTGPLLRYASERGWKDLYGLEISRDAAKIARKIEKTTIFETTIMNNVLEGEIFDLIVFWDVMEHLNDLGGTLSKAYDMLKPRGMILIGTLNQQGISLRLKGKSAYVVHPPEHLLYYSSAGLMKALKQNLFNIKDAWSFSIYLKEWTNFLLNVSNYKVKNSEVRRNIKLPNMMSLPMKLANEMLGLLRLGDELVMIGQKNEPI